MIPPTQMYRCRETWVNQCATDMYRYACERRTHTMSGQINIPAGPVFHADSENKYYNNRYWLFSSGSANLLALSFRFLVMIVLYEIDVKWIILNIFVNHAFIINQGWQIRLIIYIIEDNIDFYNIQNYDRVNYWMFHMLCL